MCRLLEEKIMTAFLACNEALVSIFIDLTDLK